MRPLPLLDPDTLRRLCRARDFLAAHTGEPVPLAAAARAACLSPFHFQRLFSRAFGESPHRFLTRRRIELAKRLLATDHLSVTDVWLETGYSSLGSFSAKFHALVGSPPSVWRRELRRQVGYQAQWRIAFVPACFLGRLMAGYGEPQEARSAKIAPGPHLDEAAAATLRELLGKGAFGGGVFETADCRATYEELKAKGVEFPSPPKEQFYGIEATFRDAAGNWFSLTQPKPH